MNNRTPVLDISGNYEESLIQFSRHLGTEKIRRAVFLCIYGRGTKPKSKKMIMESLGYSPAKGQQVQNALDQLSKHHLIAKSENNGEVKDGSRYLYGKEEAVRANRDKIIRFSDDKPLAKRTETKRRAPVANLPISKAVRSVSLRKKKKLVVLFLTSNPDPAYPLRVDAEMRRVQDAIRGSKFRDNVKIEYRPAADLSSLLDGLNDLHPHVIHFSGHGDPDGLITDTGKVSSKNSDHGEHLSYDLLAKALTATDFSPHVLVLNSCWGSRGIKALKPAVKFLISMNAPISDLAAATFAPRLYAALSSGQSIKSSFDQAILAVEAASISDATTPELYSQEDPSSFHLT